MDKYLREAIEILLTAASSKSADTHGFIQCLEQDYITLLQHQYDKYRRKHGLRLLKRVA